MKFYTCNSPAVSDGADDLFWYCLSGKKVSDMDAAVVSWKVLVGGRLQLLPENVLHPVLILVAVGDEHVIFLQIVLSTDSHML